MSRRDNRGTAPGRLFGVPDEEGWEAEIRRALAAQAGGPRPMPDDLAGTVLRRAHRVQWRRRTVGLASVAIATLLATGGLFQGLPETGSGSGESVSYRGVAGDPVASPNAPEPPEPEEVRLAADESVTHQLDTDVIGPAVDGGLVLATGGGPAARLAPIESVATAHRVGDGWVVTSGDTGTARLWWVAPDATPQVVLSGMDSIVVEQGRVAWRRGAVLAAAVVSGGELRQRATTGAPAGGGEPVGFLGGVVLLGRTGADGVAGWDVWDPVRGDYEPAWTEQVVRVYGSLPRPAGAVGLVRPPPGGEGPCLARLHVQAAGLVADPPVCGPGLPDGEVAAVSPDGRWLVAARSPDPVAADPPDERVLVVDLAAALAGDAGAVAEVPGVAGPIGQLMWLGSDQAVCVTAGSVVRVWPERVLAAAPEAVMEITLSGTAPTLVQVSTP